MNHISLTLLVLQFIITNERAQFCHSLPQIQRKHTSNLFSLQFNMFNSTEFGDATPIVRFDKFILQSFQNEYLVLNDEKQKGRRLTNDEWTKFISLIPEIETLQMNQNYELSEKTALIRSVFHNHEYIGVWGIGYGKKLMYYDKGCNIPLKIVKDHLPLAIKELQHYIKYQITVNNQLDLPPFEWFEANESAAKSINKPDMFGHIPEVETGCLSKERQIWNRAVADSKNTDKIWCYRIKKTLHILSREDELMHGNDKKGIVPPFLFIILIKIYCSANQSCSDCRPVVVNSLSSEYEKEFEANI